MGRTIQFLGKMCMRDTSTCIRRMPPCPGQWALGATWPVDESILGGSCISICDSSLGIFVLGQFVLRPLSEYNESHFCTWNLNNHEYLTNVTYRTLYSTILVHLAWNERKIHHLELFLFPKGVPKGEEYPGHAHWHFGTLPAKWMEEEMAADDDQWFAC